MFENQISSVVIAIVLVVSIIILNGISVLLIAAILRDSRSIRQKFGSPSSGKFELDWTVRQLLSCVSESAANRWYEARALVHLGFFVSSLCAMGVLYVGEFLFMITDSQGKTTKRYYHGFRGFEKLKTVVLSDVEKARREAKVDGYFDGVLITGHNYVSSWTC